MEAIFDLSEYSWIEDQLEKYLVNPREEGFRVWHIIPKGFQAYCKILPPIYEDSELSNDLRSWAEIQYKSEERRLLENRNTFPDFNFPAKRVLWKELAQLQGTQYTPQISKRDLWNSSWPIRYVGSASEGELPPEIASRLSKLLSVNGKNNEYFFSYVDGDDWKKPYSRLYKAAFSGQLRRIKMSEMFPGSVAYWWGANHDWCLCMDYDLDFAFFGGSKELVELLIIDNVLECIGIEINARYNTYWSMP